MKRILLIFLAFCLFGLASPVLAKKRIGSAKRVSIGITISPRLRKDRRALIANFSNLNQVFSFTYELTYLTNGVDQGAYGSVTPKGENSTVRELLFGTCSHGVCRYHTGIENMRFVVTANLKNSQKIIKKYRIKP